MSISLNLPITDDVGARTSVIFLLRLPICIRGWALLVTDVSVREVWAQKARSFELQAALALAKLYQSTGRPAEAHDILAPALEGFSPTPEMPVIAKAQTLLAALA